MVTNIERFANRIKESSTDPNFQKGAELLRAFATSLGSQGLLPQEVMISPESIIERKPIYTHPLFEYDPNERTIEIEGKKKEIRQSTAQILDYFIRNTEKIIPRGVLYKLIDPLEKSEDTNTLVRVHINAVRTEIAGGRKIRSPIITVRSAGYIFRGPEYTELQPIEENEVKTHGTVWERTPPALK